MAEYNDEYDRLLCNLTQENDRSVIPRLYNLSARLGNHHSMKGCIISWRRHLRDVSPTSKDEVMAIESWLMSHKIGETFRRLLVEAMDIWTFGLDTHKHHFRDLLEWHTSSILPDFVKQSKPLPFIILAGVNAGLLFIDVDFVTYPGLKMPCPPKLHS